MEKYQIIKIPQIPKVFEGTDHLVQIQIFLSLYLCIVDLLIIQTKISDS